MADWRDHEELVVITKTYDLILWSCHHTGKFPRNHRFVLGERMESDAVGKVLEPFSGWIQQAVKFVGKLSQKQKEQEANANRKGKDAGGGVVRCTRPGTGPGQGQGHVSGLECHP